MLVIIIYGFFCAFLCFLFIASFLLRDTPGWSSVWKCFKWFFVIAIVNLTGNYVKKEIKAWWNKD